MNVTTFDVDGWKAAGLAGVNIAINECGPAGRNTTPPKAKPPVTDTGAPRLEVPSLNWTVPVALVGVTFAKGSANPPNPGAMEIRVTESVVLVAVAPGVGVGVGLGVGVGVGLGVGLGV
ncbi:MAG: hypothetical protein ACRDRU_18590, partial [Pseudonocardiaceae bacterium]